MRDELRAPPLEEILTKQKIPLNVAVQLGEKLINSRHGPILNVSKVPDDEISSPIHQYLTNIQNTTVFSSTGLNDPENTGGSSLSENKAKIAAIGEAIERYCLSLVDYSDLVHGVYDSLSDRALDPTSLNKYSERQLEEKEETNQSVSEKRYYWTASRELNSGKKVLIPAQTVYIPFDSNFYIRAPITTGGAAGMSFRSAVYRAICEIIERECFIISYLNRLSHDHINKKTLPQETETYLNQLSQRGYDVSILDVSLDHPLKTCLAIGVNKSENPSVNLGLSCEMAMKNAATGAVRELFQIIDWEVDAQEYAGKYHEIITLEERARYWNSGPKVNDLKFWLNPKQTVEMRDFKSTNDDRFQQIIEYLAEEGYDCYISDVTTEDVERNGFKVIKALIPELHPMHLIEKNKYLGGDRLYDAPVESGHIDDKNSESELNNTPHPFL